MALLQVQPLLDTWQTAGWEEFVRLADDPRSDNLKCYYYNGQMRFEAMSTGADHSKDHRLILFALSFIEISDTSLADDLGVKRLQYEELGIPEYWIVNVQAKQILAFAIAADGSIRRIRESQVLPGLKLEILEQALERTRQESQSVTNAWMMQQLRT